MDTKNNMDAEDIYGAAKNEIVKRRDNRQTIIYVLLLIAGVVMIAMGGNSQAMLLGGIVLTAVGVVLMAFCGRRYIYRSTGSPVDKHSVYFDSEDREAVTSALELGDIARLGRMKKGESAPVRLDALVSRDGEFGVCQLFAWVPHSYEPQTAVKRLPGEQAAAMRELIKVSAPV